LLVTFNFSLVLSWLVGQFVSFNQLIGDSLIIKFIFWHCDYYIYFLSIFQIYFRKTFP